MLLKLNIAMNLDLRHPPTLIYRVPAIREDKVIILKMQIASLEVVG